MNILRAKATGPTQGEKMKSDSSTDAALRLASSNATRAFSSNAASSSLQPKNIKIIKSATSANQDIAVKAATSKLAIFGNQIRDFLINSVKYEWSAVFVSCVSAIPSNLLSCVLVIWGADWLRAHNAFESEAMYISAVSILTGVVGYSTYLLMYYAGMLFKERADLFINGEFSWTRLGHKGRVIWYDFMIHLPADFFALPLLSAGQGGLYIAGVSQFWSIFWAQAIADASAAVKEPFFWHGAKQLAARATSHTQISNDDLLSSETALTAAMNFDQVTGQNIKPAVGDL